MNNIKFHTSTVTSLLDIDVHISHTSKKGRKKKDSEYHVSEYLTNQ